MPPLTPRKTVAKSPAQDAADALLAALVDEGLTDVLLSPGSRSQALALAALNLERAGFLRVHVRIDERVAGFTALGIAREQRRPVAVICTSGTAVANLVPAALEARHAGVGLLLLTADRPPELLGVGANQTTDQPGVFTGVAKWVGAVLTPGAAEVPAVAASDDAAGLLSKSAQTQEAAAVGGRSAREVATSPEFGPNFEVGPAPGAAAAEAAAAGRAAFAAASAYPAGPAHLNLPYREPLSGESSAAGLLSKSAQTQEVAAVGGRSAREVAASPEFGPNFEVGPAPGGLAAAGQGTGAAGLGVDAESAQTQEVAAVGGRSAHEVAASPEFGPDFGVDPASADASAAPAAPAAAGLAPAARVFLPRGPRTIVIAGADAGPAAEQFAHEAHAPLIAEVTSNARYGRNLIAGYRAALNDPQLGGRIERAVVFGHPTLSREVTRALSRSDIDVIAVDGPGERVNLNHQTTAAAAVDIEPGEADREWLGAWLTHGRANAVDFSAPAPDSDALHSHDPLTRAQAMRTELGVVREPLTRQLVADAAWRATWPHDRLVFGASRMIRVADQVLPGKKVVVHANRGLAGIDGTIATAIGIALASQAEGALGTTRVLLGDLALLHDVGALLLPDGEPHPRIQLIVANDRGGTIFDSLEVAEGRPEGFDRAFYTPHNAGFAALAEAYGWQYAQATTRAQLDTLLSAAPGPQLIEVPLPR